jgi:hypothetical protein
VPALQGCGIGAGLLRTVAAADIAGIRAFVVHAKDDTARTFYARLRFESFTDLPPADEGHPRDSAAAPPKK